MVHASINHTQVIWINYQSDLSRHISLEGFRFNLHSAFLLMVRNQSIIVVIAQIVCAKLINIIYI